MMASAPNTHSAASLRVRTRGACTGARGPVRDCFRRVAFAIGGIMSRKQPPTIGRGPAPWQLHGNFSTTSTPPAAAHGDFADLARNPINSVSLIDRGRQVSAKDLPGTCQGSARLPTHREHETRSDYD